MSKQIQPVDIWINGEIKTAKFFQMVSVYDNLDSEAKFNYELLTEKIDDMGNPIPGDLLIASNLKMAGQDYEDWGNQSGTDINTWAYDWAASQLNLTIIP